MRFLGIVGHALGVVAASAILSACGIGGSQSTGFGGAPDLDAMQGGKHWEESLRLTMASENALIGQHSTHAFNIFHPKRKRPRSFTFLIS